MMRAFPRFLSLALIGLAPATVFASGPVQITITRSGCEPSEVAVAAGKPTFEITNKSNRALEWEILHGVMIVAERENILPGFTQRLSARLDAGDYAMTCGLLSNPRGVIRVVAEPGAVAGPVDPMDLVGPVAEYKLFVQDEAGAYVARVADFVAAVKAGDVAGAKALYSPARAPFERIEPIAELFSDLDQSMDSREDDWEHGVKDPGFTGFHRIEYALWVDESTEGMGPVADRLLADARDLADRIKGLAVPPSVMIAGAGALIEEVAATKITGEEDRYSHTDLADFEANVVGARKIVDLIAPLVETRDPALLAGVEANFQAVEAVLARYRKADGSFEGYDMLTRQDRLAMQGPITALAEDLARVPGILGLEV
ncbi:MAG: iron uptake system protein EfeO [Rhodobacteraceae bacterium]|nr:iron uptake system protein EfeO [Paracoccaceae bacterium]